MDAMPDLPDAVRECCCVDDVTQVPWLDYNGCPYRPYGRDRFWAVFEEYHPRFGHAPKRVRLTVKQVRDGDLNALSLNYHLLEAWFPATDLSVGGHGWKFDRAKVADWLFYHIANAETARLNRYQATLQAAGRWPDAPALAQACVKPAPAQAPVATKPAQTEATLSLPSGRGTRLEIRTVHVRSTFDGGAVLVVTIHPPMGDDFAVTANLTLQQRTALAHALSREAA